MSTTTVAPRLPANVTLPVPTSRVPRPFSWLQPAHSLSSTALRGLGDLRELTADSAALLTRGLVEFSLHDGRTLNLVAQRRSPSVSVLNRRRRAARLWIIAILNGQCDEETTRAVTRSWLRQLAGTGPDPKLAVDAGRRFLEYLRGAFTALLFDSSAPNLVPQARALSALEGVLAVHLHAIDALAES